MRQWRLFNLRSLGMPLGPSCSIPVTTPVAVASPAAPSPSLSGHARPAPGTWCSGSPPRRSMRPGPPGDGAGPFGPDMPSPPDGTRLSPPSEEKQVGSHFPWFPEGSWATRFLAKPGVGHPPVCSLPVGPQPTTAHTSGASPAASPTASRDRLPGTMFSRGTMGPPTNPVERHTQGSSTTQSPRRLLIRHVGPGPLCGPMPCVFVVRRGGQWLRFRSTQAVALRRPPSHDRPGAGPGPIAGATFELDGATHRPGSPPRPSCPRPPPFLLLGMAGPAVSWRPTTGPTASTGASAATPGCGPFLRMELCFIFPLLVVSVE